MKRKVYRIRLAALAALGFGSLVSCNPEEVPCMYGTVMYGPPSTEMIPAPDQPEMSESPAPADSKTGTGTDTDTDAVSK